MGFGIAIMGLNGAGKTTLGKCFKKKRDESIVIAAMDALSCPKMVLSGTDAPEENAKKILWEAQKYMR